MTWLQLVYPIECPLCPRKMKVGGDYEQTTQASEIDVHTREKKALPIVSYECVSVRILSGGNPALIRYLAAATDSNIGNEFLSNGGRCVVPALSVMMEPVLLS